MSTKTTDSVYLKQLNIVVNTLNNMVSKLDDDVAAAEKANDKFNASYEEAKRLIEALEDDIEEIDTDMMEDAGLSPDQLKSICTERKARFDNSMNKLEYKNWDQFVQSCMVQSLKDNTYEFLPWDAMLTETDLKTLKDERYEAQYKWDKWDYTFVGIAGVLAALTDFFIVKGPAEMMRFDGKTVAPSPLTAFLKEKINSKGGEKTWFSEWANGLEKTCKVPYDAVAGSGLEGMGGRTHRFQTLGHDPILGFVFGVLDIYRGTITGFSYDRILHNHKLAVNPNADFAVQESLISSFILQFKHLVSDVGTSAGLPPPFFSLLQGVNVKVPTSPKGRTVAEIARWMYMNGYDLRHFITMGITPAVIEIILRLYIMIKHYSIHGDVKFILANNPKYRSMLLSAHAIAAAANAGKVALHKGNPLAINYNEWLALFRYLIPSIKYWVFDKQRLKLEHMERINEQGWDDLLVASSALLESVYSEDMPLIELGKA